MGRATFGAETGSLEISVSVQQVDEFIESFFFDGDLSLCVI